MPLFVKQDFGDFYKAMFDRAVAREKMRAVFVEYAWDMGWCDPCAADPLSNKQLVELGARWIGSDDERRSGAARAPTPIVTRLHVRYDAQHFPEDLVLMETTDRTNFQGRYILRHPWTGRRACEAGEQVSRGAAGALPPGGANLADLTGWPPAEIERRMEAGGQPLRGR